MEEIEVDITELMLDDHEMRISKNENNLLTLARAMEEIVNAVNDGRRIGVKFKN